MLVDNYSDIIGAYPAYPYYDSHDSLFEIFSGTYCILACSFVYSDMSSGMSFCKCLKCFGTYFLTHLLAFFDILAVTYLLTFRRILRYKSDIFCPQVQPQAILVTHNGLSDKVRDDTEVLESCHERQREQRESRGEPKRN